MNKAIVITEKQILEAMDAMCAESLSPETHDAWERVKAELVRIRTALSAAPVPSTVGQEDATPVRNDLLRFLHGEGTFEGCEFGERPFWNDRGNFWWRMYLPKATPQAAPEQEVKL